SPQAENLSPSRFLLPGCVLRVLEGSLRVGEKILLNSCGLICWKGVFNHDLHQRLEEELLRIVRNREIKDLASLFSCSSRSSRKKDYFRLDFEVGYDERSLG